MLPWEGETVITHVVRTLEQVTPGEIVVVTGHRAEEVAAALAGTRARSVVNPDYTTGEMLSSVQTGLRALSVEATATLICLGDQPQMEAETARRVVETGRASGGQALVIPSYQMRAGHPILCPAGSGPMCWPDRHAERCAGPHRTDAVYIVVDTPSVLADLDTPADL